MPKQNLALIENEDWYQFLIEECRAIMVEKTFNAHWEIVEGHWLIGKCISEKNENFERSKIYGNQITQRVAESLNRSQRTIEYEILFYRLFPDLCLLPEGKNINWRGVVRKYLTRPTADEIAAIEATKFPPTIQLLDGDFRQTNIDSESVDLILTDPPYPKEYLPLWDNLGAFGARVLKPGGYLVAYSGEFYLRDVLNSLSKHLKYFWSFCLTLPGSSRLLPQFMIINGWKPILVFYKPPFKKSLHALYDVIGSPRVEKELHEWQQSEGGVKKLIEYFSKEGDLVLDPFSGSGTFVKVAHEMGRSATGIEIDKDSNLKAKQRILTAFNDNQQVGCEPHHATPENAPVEDNTEHFSNIDSGHLA